MNSSFFSNFWAVVKGLKKPVWIIAALVIAAVVFLVVNFSGCKSAIPIVIQNQLVNCEAKVENVDGTLTFTGCKLDGTQDATAPAEGDPGDDVETNNNEGGNSFLLLRRYVDRPGGPGAMTESRAALALLN